MSKVMSVSEALGLIHDGDAIAMSSAGGCGWAEYVVRKLEERFLAENHPRGLTLYAGCGQDDDRFAHPGFATRFIASHPKTAPAMLDLAIKGELEAYALPQGILQQLYRCSAAKQPGLLSKIGIGTYIDPRQSGGKLCSACKDDIVSLMEIDGQEWLFYRSQPVTIGIVRGTTADKNGNITVEKEALRLEILEIALAVKASKGKMIVQVERIAANNSLRPSDVVIPGELVDAVVVCEEPEKYHRMTMFDYYLPYYSGELRGPEIPATTASNKLEGDDLVCRRAVYELFPGAVINVGIGIGVKIGDVAEVEGVVDKLTFTVELGVFGGTPGGFGVFPATRNPTSFVAHPHMFDFYHAGGLDIAFLGAAQIDRQGNVNASRFNNVSAGQGGFIDISSTSKKVVFITYFKAKGLKAVSEGCQLKILEEGKIPKLVNKVDEITFSGQTALAGGQEVLFCTERAVFQLTKGGLLLTEIAPGVDLEKDILAQMEFVPLISEHLKNMDARIFTPGRMGCFDGP